jgi:hypothetical protein
MYFGAARFRVSRVVSPSRSDRVVDPGSAFLLGGRFKMAVASLWLRAVQLVRSSSLHLVAAILKRPLVKCVKRDNEKVP